MNKKILFLLCAVCSALTAFAGPNIQATPQVLNSFNYTASGPSASQTVVLQSAIMAVSAGNVIVTGSAHYEVSLNNTAFGNSASIPYSGDTLAATNLYIRLKAGLPVGDYSNETISVMATGVSKNITASGLVTAPCTVTTGSITATTAAFTWNATGAVSYECIIDQSAAAPAITGTVATTTSYTQSGLTAGKAYYFHVRGVGNGGNYTGWTTNAFSTKSTGIDAAPGNYTRISLLPNPNHGIFTITGKLAGAGKNVTVSITVINALGQIVFAGDTPSSGDAFSKEVALNNMPAGFYTAAIGTGSGNQMLRFTVAP